jgi:hypothetical protein
MMEYDKRALHQLTLVQGSNHDNRQGNCHGYQDYSTTPKRTEGSQLILSNKDM